MNDKKSASEPLGTSLSFLGQGPNRKVPPEHSARSLLVVPAFSLNCPESRFGREVPADKPN